jgi:endonuclease/exonuclease/phosphatase (EEP) superfamily protein YafD
LVAELVLVWVPMERLVQDYCLEVGLVLMPEFREALLAWQEEACCPEEADDLDYLVWPLALL